MPSITYRGDCDDHGTARDHDHTGPPATVPPTTDTTVVTPQTSTPNEHPADRAPTTDVTITHQERPLPAPSVPTTAAPRGGTLPRTGQDAQPLVATAIVLLATGTLLGILARRRRDG